MQPTSLARFLSAPLNFVDINNSKIAYRQFGKGPTLLMIHGWPLNGATYRYIIPLLEAHFTCIVPDSAGLGESEWNRSIDLSFHAQANRMHLLMDKLNIEQYHIFSHDTGATIGRLLAARDTQRVKSIVVINTEIMHHKPRLIPLYKTLLSLPGATLLFSQMLKAKAFIRSYLGFGNVYVNKARLNDDFLNAYIKPLTAKREKIEGVIAYLHSIDWSVINGLHDTHRAIEAPIVMIWGKEDFFFPIHRAQALVGLSPHCEGLVEINNAGLLPHEECPEAVFNSAFSFWQKLDFVG